MASAATVTRYARQLARLLPPGRLLKRLRDTISGHGSTGADLLHGLSEELGRVDDRARDLREEADPRTTTELLEDWERLVGLPDPCQGQLPTIEERRAAIVARLVALPSATPQAFVDKAAEIGFTVTIEERSECWCAGVGAAGDRLYVDEWVFVWTVHADSELSDAEKAQLECTLSRLVPAHTKVTFAYDLVG